MSQTHFLTNKDGDIMCCWDGDVARMNIIEFNSGRPYTPEDVTRMMNKAFRIGMDAKAGEVKNVLGIR